MTTEQPSTTPPTKAASRVAAVRDVVSAIPDGPIFAVLATAWLLLFHFFGNSNLGNIKTTSLFHWMDWVYQANEDDALGQYIPFVVIGLLWWKRDELRQVKTRRWWPALLLVVIALAFHFVGFFIQQNRLSIVGLYLGFWGFAGALWGPGLMRATFFPACLLPFCVPITAVADTVTFPLRLFATTITTYVSQYVLGINVIQQGTFIFDESGRYSYEVAAACSGIRSLTAIFVLTTIYAFVLFKTTWKRITVVLLGFPLVVISNVLRLVMIILASEAVSPQAGSYVHDSTIMSLLPYIVAFAGILLGGRLLREERDMDIKDAAIPVIVAVAGFMVPRWIWAKINNESPVVGHVMPEFGIGSLAFVTAVAVVAFAAFVRDRNVLRTMSRSAWRIGTVGLVLIGGFAAVAVTRSAWHKLSPPGVKLVPELVYAVSPTNKVLAGTNAVYLPERVLAYESKPLPLASIVYEWLPKDTTYGQRRYIAADGFVIDNMVVLMGTDRTSIHRPEFCISGQGLHVLSETNSSVQIREPYPYDLPVRKLHFGGTVLAPNGEKQHANGVFVYWFVSDDQITADNDHRMSEAMREFVRSGTIKRWAYVITMAFCAPGQEEAAFERIKTFIRSSVPEYQLTAGEKR